MSSLGANSFIQKKPSFWTSFNSSLKNVSAQKIAIGCTYSAFICISIGLFLVDYSRLAFPFVIAAIPLLFLTGLSRSENNPTPHLRFALVAAVFWLLLADAIGAGIFRLGEQTTDINQMQGQLIQLENQHNQLQVQEKELNQQLTIFLQIKNASGSQPYSLDDEIRTTMDALATIRTTQPYTDVLIDYTAAQIQQNNRNLLDDTLAKNDQQNISSNDDQIQINRGLIAYLNGRMMANNLVLSDSQRTFLAPLVLQKSCVSGYPCNIQFSWQQPFLDGWSYVTTAPLATIWPFWLLFLLSLSGILVMLPYIANRYMGRLLMVTYRLRYSGPLSGLKDSAFPQQKRQMLSPESSIVKIEIASKSFRLKKDDLSDKTQNFLSLNLGSGMGVHDVFLAQNARRSSVSPWTVSYDRATGNIVIKLGPTMPIKGKNTGQTGLVHQFPIEFYVVVDYFAGSLEATPAFPKIRRLREQRGPGWLIGLGDFLPEIILWTLATSFYLVLSDFSTIFFERSIQSPQVVLLPGIAGLIVPFVLVILGFIINKATIRRPRPLALDPFVS